METNATLLIWRGLLAPLARNCLKGVPENVGMDIGRLDFSELAGTQGRGEEGLRKAVHVILWGT